MTVKRNHTLSSIIYFVTITCIDFKNLIDETNLYDFILLQFNILNKEGCFICGFVIMPNHFHFLLYIPPSVQLNKRIGNMKRFMSYEIINRLNKMDNKTRLEQLSNHVSNSDSIKGKKHDVFIDSFDAKMCWGHDFIEQKLDYMHRNPIQGKWNLSEDVISYAWSSASFYLNHQNEKHPFLKDYRNIIDEGLIVF